MNKEQLRKELEDCWDAAGSRCTAVLSVGSDNAKPPDKHTYITTRLAAIDDGDGVESKTLRDELAEKDSSPYNETKDARVVAFKNGWDAAEHNLKPRWFKAGGMAERILIKNPNGVDDGQEGKGLEKAITEIEQRKRDAVNTAGFDDKLAAGEIYAYGEALAIIKKHLAALPVADGENEKK